jgi:hypothetical protein
MRDSLGRQLSEQCPYGHLDGEFDPGSGTTLAACLMHASRTGATSVVDRGGRVRNTWATHPSAGDNGGKPSVIPHELHCRWDGEAKVATPCLAGPAAYQLAGGVVAHQGDDG